MKITLDLNGKELVLVYLMTGNQDAREIILNAIRAEREFNQQTNQGGKHGRRKRF